LKREKATCGGSKEKKVLWGVRKGGETLFEESGSVNPWGEKIGERVLRGEWTERNWRGGRYEFGRSLRLKGRNLKKTKKRCGNTLRWCRSCR